MELLLIILPIRRLNRNMVAEALRSSRFFPMVCSCANRGVFPRRKAPASDHGAALAHHIVTKTRARANYKLQHWKDKPM